jgi:hypothetical protein
MTYPTTVMANHFTTALRMTWKAGTILAEIAASFDIR